MWTNYHTHSIYCDGKLPVSQCVDYALNRGLLCFGMSSHAPLPFETTWAMKSEDLDRYIAELTHLKEAASGLQFYKGLEVDFIPGKTGPGKFSDRLDYTIGSVHFIDPDDHGDYVEIDGPHNKFLFGLEHVYKGNVKDTIKRYFELTCKMLADDPPDVLGHFDKIKIQNIDGKFFDESDRWYRELVFEVLDATLRSGVIVEVNTRGIYQKKCPSTYPSPWILEKLFERRVPITLSSDAHHPSDLINQFPETARLLAGIGFTHLTCLIDGEWRPYRFNEIGLIR